MTTCQLANLHHVEFHVSNASQTAFWYCCSFGFQRFAHKKTYNSYSIAVRNGKARLLFTSVSKPTEVEKLYSLKHGDSAKDIAFRVDSLEEMQERLTSPDVNIVNPITIDSDSDGTVRWMKIRVKDTDLMHTLIDSSNYKGLFLPNFISIDNFKLTSQLEPVRISLVDHVVENHDNSTMADVELWYKKTLQLERFWSIDDQLVDKSMLAVRTHLLRTDSGGVQLTLAESAMNRKKDQILEYLEFNGGPGIQHVALLVDDIIEAIRSMRGRCVEFLEVPNAYYDMLKERLQKVDLDVKEDIEVLRELNILMDFDEKGYLLQIFTKPCQDRPTLFIEIIQRHNFNGFGAGNVKALFEAVEREQQQRGTLA